MLIIYPPTVQWDFMIARPQQLMSAFSEQGDTVIFCEPGIHEEKKMKKIKDRLWLDYGAPLHQWAALTKETKRVLWISYPGNVSKIGNYDEDIIVYDVLDYPDDDFATWKPYVQELLEKCQIVLTVSKPLFNHFKELHPNVHLVRNAVDYNFFANVTADEASMDIKQICKPIVGFYGALAPWVDWQLIEELAVRNPSVSFVLIGPTIAMKTESLPKRPNIFFLGHKPYEQLPKYAVHFDVCMFPFKKTRMTSYVNPVKIYEYLALGKPVVATDLPEILELSPHIYAAGNREEFHGYLVGCLNNYDNNSVESRKKFALENTWAERVKQIKRIIGGY